MRILYHHRTQGEEPEAIHINSIVNALNNLGHRVLVVGPSPVVLHGGVNKPSVLGHIKKLVPRVVFEFLQFAYNVVVYFRLRRALRDFQPDLIYERYALYTFAGVLLARRCNIPLILEVNTPYAHAWAQYFGLFLKRLACWIERRTLIAATHIITVTVAQQQLLTQAGIPLERISVCHNAIDPDWFNLRRHTDPQVRRRLGLSGVVVGFVGTMNRWQGITEFPNVLRTVISQRDDVTFLFVGDGEFRGFLEKFCANEGLSSRVVFTGRKAHIEIPPLIAAMDIAVLLNSNDYGSPMKIFEYLGMEKAVIAPRVGPVMEVLQDGETGLIIQPGNAREMSEKILQLANDTELRRRLGASGHAYVTSHHTWQLNAAKIIDIYNQHVKLPIHEPSNLN